MEGAIAHNLESGEQRTSDVASGSVSFKDFKVKRALLCALKYNGFVTPTKIQAAAIPIALSKTDLVVQSKSGTGKTLIYVMTAIQQIVPSIAKPQVLIIVPTRELAIQVEDTCNGLVFKSFRNNYNCCSFYGGTDVTKDRQRMATGRIIVGTPGRLLHLVRNQVFETSHIRLCVLDEADQLYSTESLRKDVDVLIAPLLKKTQIIACSATYPNELDEQLAKLMDCPILVSNSERATVLLGVRQFVCELPEHVNSMQDIMLKLDTLYRIFEQLSYEQCILFAASQSRADSFCTYLKRNKVECELMSAAMKQVDRRETFQAYRDFKLRTLVATDLMARGVDFSHANLVINMDPPKDIITYLHRIGRAGRFGSKGIAITFISTPKQSEQFKRMIGQVGTGMSVLQFPSEKIEGMNFWDFDSYNFPYFLKTEAHEQDIDLWRIRQPSKPKARVMEYKTDPYGNNYDIRYGPDKSEVTYYLNTKQEFEDLAINSDPKLTVVNPQADTTNEANIAQEQSNIMEPQSASTELTDLYTNDPELAKLELTNCISTQNTLENTENVDDNQLKSNYSNHSLQLPLEHNANQLELHDSIKEQTPSAEIPAAAPNSINTKTYCLAAPSERSSTTLQPMGISNTVDDASSIISDSVENAYDSDASYSSFYSSSDARLILRRALSQRKLQKRRNRNAKRKSIPIFNKDGVSPATWSDLNTQRPKIHKIEKEEVEMLASSLKKWKKYRNSKKTSYKLEINNVTFNNPKKIVALEVSNKLNKFNNLPQIQQRLQEHMKKCQYDLEKFGHFLKLLNDAMDHFYYVDHNNPKKKSVLAKSSISNVVKSNDLMGVSNKPSLAELDQNNDETVELQKPMSKLSVHVVQQLNIPPANVPDEGNDPADSIHSEAGSGSGSPVASQNNSPVADEDFSEQSEDDDSMLVYSSSGFAESAESASSGIDTSQYDSNSSELESDDYEENEEEEEDESDFDTDSASVSTVTFNGDNQADNEESGGDGLSQNNSETSSVSDTVAGSVNSSETVSPDFALAQTRWRQLFYMQYQFIATYVNNYMTNYPRQE